MAKPQVFEIYKANIREKDNAHRNRKEGKRALEGCLQDTIKNQAVPAAKDFRACSRAVLCKTVWL